MKSILPPTFTLRRLLLLSILCLCSSGTSSWGQQTPKPPIKFGPGGSVDHKELLKLTRRPATSDRITDEELGAIKERHLIDYGPGFRKTERPKMPARGDLYANSVLISDGKNHTLVPKEAVIFVPEHLSGRIVEERVGKLIVWPEFYETNSRWLRAKEVSYETAKGDDPLSEEEMDVIRLGNAIVVSVYNQFPISMKVPERPSEGSLAGETGARPTSESGGNPEGAIAMVSESEASGGGQEEADPAIPEGAPVTAAASNEGDSEQARVVPLPNRPSAAQRPSGTSTSRSGAFDRLKRSSGSRFSRDPEKAP